MLYTKPCDLLLRLQTLIGAYSVHILPPHFWEPGILQPFNVTRPTIYKPIVSNVVSLQASLEKSLVNKSVNPLVNW